MIRRISIRARLVVAFGTIILLFVAGAVAGIVQLQKLSAISAELGSGDMNAERTVGDWRAATQVNLVRAMALAQSTDAELAKMLAPQMENTTKLISGLQKKAESLIERAEEKAALNEIAKRRKLYLDARAQVLAARKAGDDTEAGRLLQQSMAPAVQAYQESQAKLAELVRERGSARAAQGAAAATAGQHFLLLFFGLALTAAIVLGWMIVATITTPVAYAAQVAESVAAGDLATPIDPGAKDEIGRLLAALERMRGALAQAVTAIRTAAENVSAGANEIAQGNASLSQRTEMQASTLEETAASMEQLTATVKQNSEHVQRAHGMAEVASGIAEKGGVTVRNVVSTMEGISESSRRISDIIGVIDGIAFQTNILALNAAVEAARAGEQGRGFAVVAAEVRSLAQRSASAAKEIKGLIGESVARVQEGVQWVGGAGKTIDEIVSAVSNVQGALADIASASRQQQAGIGQVSQAVQQIEQVTQQNAAQVEEAAAAAENLAGQADLLVLAVARFKLKTDGRVTRTAAASATSTSLPARGAGPRLAQPTTVPKRPAGDAAGAKPFTALSQPMIMPRGHAPDDGEWKEF